MIIPKRTHASITPKEEGELAIDDDARLNARGRVRENARGPQQRPYDFRRLEKAFAKVKRK